MTHPLVSVVLPTKDRPQMLERAVRSVLEQTYEPIELHVVDDGSATPAAERFTGLPTDELAGFEVHRHETNRGGNAARKTGLEAATGKYVAFLDDDDEWLPEKTTRQVAALENAEAAGVSYTQNRQLVSPEETRSVHRPGPGGDIAERILFGNYIGGFSVVMAEAALLECVGGPDERFPAWQDWELHVRLAQETEYVAVADPLVRRYVDHDDRISPAYSIKREIASLMFETRLQTPARRHGVLTEVQAALQARLARAAQLEAQYTTARAHFASAIRLDPRNRSYYVYLLALSGGRFTFVPARTLKHVLSRYLSA